MKVYGYVRDINGCFTEGRKLILSTANSLSLDVDKIYAEQSSGEYDKMLIAQQMVSELHDCILILPDTSELYFTDYAAMHFMKNLNNQNVFVIDCAYLEFDNIHAESNRSRDLPYAYLINNLIIQIEVYLRNRKENPFNESDGEILKLKGRIKEFFKDNSLKGEDI